MPATFTLIDANEMVEFLLCHEFVEAPPRRSERCFVRHEKIGKMPVDIFFLTTLSVGGTIVRDSGTDAMRLWVTGYDTQGIAHRISKVKNFHRTQRWGNTISKVLGKWSELVKYRCFTCNTPLVFHTTQQRRLYCCYCNPQG